MQEKSSETKLTKREIMQKIRYYFKLYKAGFIDREMFYQKIAELKQQTNK